MSFRNREQAGQLLAEQLSHYRNHDKTVVIGLARGGVVTAHAVAKALHLPLDVICLRKIGAPFNPELALGAIGTTGDVFLNEDLIERLNVPSSYLEAEKRKEKALAEQREALYHKAVPPVNVADKTVILVDDGLATGATMKAAIIVMEKKNAEHIVVAVPVSAPETLDEVSQMAPETFCLMAPPFFQAVGQFYDDFSQVEDDEVITLLGLHNQGAKDR